MRRGTAFAVVALAFAACAASLPIERREYILARPHGWIELAVADAAIPMVPKDDEASELVKPDSCYFTVSLDREPYFEGALYPDGDAEPFRVSSGFRFPAPVGTPRIHVEYAGCDGMEGGELRRVEVEITVPVAESMVTDLAFDGDALSAGGPRADTAVTLERIYDAVREGR